VLESAVARAREQAPELDMTATLSPHPAAAELTRRGHRTRRVGREANPMGRAQCIVIDPATGALSAGSDSRGEGSAGGW
jgi:gamma-glutamyltranspeptidase